MFGEENAEGGERRMEDGLEAVDHVNAEAGWAGMFDMPVAKTEICSSKASRCILHLLAE